jgi:hypothetical protein
MATYRWYSVGPDPRQGGQVAILGWSRDQAHALAHPHTVAVYHASSRAMAARQAKADRGFDIDTKARP